MIDELPLVGEDWIAAATREQLEAEVRRLTEAAIRNLQRTWKAERTVEPPDGLREEIAQTLHDAEPRGWLHYADALLAGPLTPLLAKLQAVETLAEEWENGTVADLPIYAPQDFASLLRAAVAGPEVTS